MRCTSPGVLRCLASRCSSRPPSTRALEVCGGGGVSAIARPGLLASHHHAESAWLTKLLHLAPLLHLMHNSKSFLRAYLSTHLRLLALWGILCVQWDYGPHMVQVHRATQLPDP
jgi:hypothetical protein